MSAGESIYSHAMVIVVMQTVTIPVKEYEDPKAKAETDVKLLRQLVESFKDIKAGRFRMIRGCSIGLKGVA